ncbi:hypothetical protein [Actinoplanes sp. G11-F43]|uniref:hypothetical protein n=1 Tax=Actinoplanes sp. G11-F43 TaxID=3424130 RepID=UPI003D33B090
MTPTQYGRVLYAVDRVGTFTLEPPTYTYDLTGMGRRVHVRYGRVDGPDPYHRSRDLPDPPRVCTIVLGGAAVLDVDDLGRSSWRTLPVTRVDGSEVPDGTRRRTWEIVLALVQDWLNRADHDELAGFHAWHHAPRRIADAERSIDRLTAKITPLLTELAAEHHRRAAELAVLGRAAPPTPALPDPATREGQAILTLRADLAALYQRHQLPPGELTAMLERWLAAQGLAVSHR